MKRIFTPLFLTAVFFSGFCSLVYQLIWDRLARYNFGGDNISATIVVTTFLLGLGIGAYLFRKPARRPLRSYGLVEIGIGCFALASFSIITNISAITAQLFSATPDSLSGIRLGAIVGCAAFLLPPCILMGGTLPMMFAAFFSREELKTDRVGFIYGLNIFGAMSGTIAVPLVLLNNFTIDAVLTAVGCVNISIGLISIALDIVSSRSTAGIAEHEKDSALGVPAERSALLVAIAFLTGAVTVIFEVMLIRHAFTMIPSSVYNISFVLLAVLCALGSGSIILPRIMKKVGISVALSSGILLLASAAGMTMSFSLSRYLVLHGMLMPDLDRIAVTNVYYLLLSLPVFFPLGAIFPILCAERSVTAEELSKRTGRLYLVNSLGALTGAVLFHLVVSAWLGVHGSFLLLIALLSLFGVLSLATVSSLRITVSAAVAFTGMIIAVSFMDPRPFLLGQAVTRYENFTVVEGTSGNASANWYDKIGNGALVCINGQGMGAIPNEPHDMRMLSATLAVSDPRTILLLGVATGSYVPPLLQRTETESLTLVDWSHEIEPLMKKDKIFVKGKQMDLHLQDKRVKFIVADARIAVTLFEQERFDLIIDTLAKPGWPGATGLKSSSYFKNVARILKPDGMLVMGTFYRGWKDGGWKDTAWRKEILAGLREAFDHVLENESASTLIASNKPITSPDVRRSESIAADYAARTKLDMQTLVETLVGGFRRITQDDIGKAVPFSENAVQSEYYFKTSDIAARLFK